MFSISFCQLPLSLLFSPPLHVNKWKNIHCPGLLLNFSLLHPIRSIAAVMSTDHPNREEEEKRRKQPERREAGNLQTSKVMLLNPATKKIPKRNNNTMNVLVRGH